MKKGYRHLILVVDASGSMGNVVSDTIGGMKAFVEGQKKDAESGTLTTVFFEGLSVRRIHGFYDFSIVENADFDAYRVGGRTNLLDAIGQTLNMDGNLLADMPEDQRPEKVCVCIITDGMENSSQEFNAKQIKEMVKEQEEKYGWDFNFVSASIEAFDQAQDYGFSRGKMAAYAKGSTQATFKSMSEKVSRTVAGGDDTFSNVERGRMVGCDGGGNG